MTQQPLPGFLPQYPQSPNTLLFPPKFGWVGVASLLGASSAKTRERQTVWVGLVLR